MRTFGVFATLVACFAASASSQQYAGDIIDTSLPNVPGSEIAFFKIPGVMDSNKKKAANLTLINYISHGSDGKRLVESKVQRAVIIIHGLNRDPGTYESNMLSALAQVTGDPNISKDSVAVMAPYFANGDDKRTGYPWTDGLSPGRGSTTSALVWKSSQWSAGGNNQYPYYSQATSSYTVLDTLIQYFDDRTLYPNMKQIVIAGHSLGAQTVQRYAALGQKLNTKSPVTYWIGNPNSYVWLSTDRPLSTASCPTYDYYREGYTNFTEYPMTYGQSLVSQGRSAILANYNSKQIAYARGTQDNGDDSSSCAPGTTGGNRNERFFNFIKAFPISCPDPRGSNCDTVDLVNMGHDGGGMFASAAGRARLFTDNFYGNGNRSYDFGYPRQQNGDDPFPDPTLNMTASSLNNNTYAGNLTYAGCWSDSGSSRTLPTQVYDNSANTIELCTSTCVSRGFSIAGVEFGSQCYCGNAMTSGASKVIESSCTAPCAGNSSESCGGSSRLSVFSNGTPNVLPPASNPETVGKFYFSNCYTETSARTLPVKSSSGSFMTLDYCADFCSGYKYFGTEYGSECYCGNTIDPLATIAPLGDCSMTCANNTIQYCGAGNRLSLFTNPDWVQPTGTSTSSAPSTPTASGGASDLACPAANSTVVTSNGLKFIVECGIDHAGGDLTSVGGVTFQQCIDACSSNSQCVDVSLSGSACYLKKAVGSAVNNPAVWGARLLTDGSGTTSTSSSASIVTSSSQLGSSSGLSSSSGTTTSATSTTSASSTPSDISCPASDATTYNSPSGQSFVIECGIDHTGGDMGMKSVSSFQQCIDACDQTTGCVDVSLSGSACYLKSTLGAAGNSPGIWGAKLIIQSVSSTSSGATSSSVSVPTPTDMSSSSSSTSSGASATPTAVSCPGSNGTFYSVASGNSFLIECGIDHQGGDLSSKDVKSFADCISLCDTTANCVDISMVGSACYLKNAVGPAVKIDYVWGAKLVVASPSSSWLTTTAATTSSSSDVVSSTAASSTSASDVSTSSSSPLASSSSSSSSSLTTNTAVTSSDADSSSSSSSSSTLDSTATSVSSLFATSTIDSTSSSSVTASTSSEITDSSLTSSSSSSTSTEITSAETTSSGSSSSRPDSSAFSTPSTPSSTTSTSQTTASSSTSSALEPSSTSTDSTSNTASSSTARSSSSSIPLSSTSISSTSIAPTSTDSTSSTASPSTATSSSSSSITPLSSSSSSSTTFSSTTASSSSSMTPPSSSTTATSSSASGFTTSTSSTTTSSAASSATAVLPAGFSYAGCFVDGSTRALPISAGTSTSQTQQQCAMTCQTKGYKYSGTEYAQECWCGNSIPSSPASESQCSMACKGDSTQKCGAGNRLSVVSDDSWKQTFFARQSFGAWNLLGCYTDSTAKRSLPTAVSLAAYGGGANATVANCVQACQAKGFAYCGAEYYSECYGSNVAPTANLAGSDPLAAGCNYPCKGNSTESCGGSARIIVYSNTGS